MHWIVTKPVIGLIGLKIDDCSNRRVSIIEAKEFASTNNLLYYEASSKTGENVLTILSDFTQNIMNSVFESKILKFSPVVYPSDRIIASITQRQTLWQSISNVFK